MPLTRPKAHQIITTTQTITDPLIEINAGASGTNTNDLGIIINRGASGDNVGIIWDRSAQKFVLVQTTSDGDATGDLTFSAFADLQVDEFVAAAVTATSISTDTFSLPTADGTSGQVLTTNGLGTVSWSDATARTDEEIQDVVGLMVTGNVESGISVTYDDVGGKLDFNVNDPTITLSGDATGSAVMTNLGNVTITTSVPGLSAKLDTATYTPADVLAKLLTVDGSGSGLDADTLDGQDSAHYLAWANFTGVPADFTPNTEATQDIVGNMVTANTENGISVTYDDVGGKLNFDVNDPLITLSGDVTGSATMTNLGNVTITTTVADDSHNHIIANVDGLQAALDAKVNTSTYTAADVLAKLLTVDGAASGIDADLLDGQQGSAYMRSDTSDTFTSGTLTIAPGASIEWATSPSTANQLANKSYVDNAVASGTLWRDALVDSDLVDVVASNPATPEATYSVSTGGDIAFIATASFTFSYGTGSTVAATAGSIVNLRITSSGNGDYTLIEHPLAAGDRFIIAAEHGTIGSTLSGLNPESNGNLANGDLIEFTGTGNGSTNASWTMPEGRSGLATHTGTEIAQGITVLVGDPDSQHYGHSYLYNAEDNAWVEIGGPGYIQAGNQLSFTGTTLNVVDGAASGLDADLLDGKQGSTYLYQDGTDNGLVTITANDADFIVQDTTDGTTNYIWRDHSGNILYLGTANAVPTLRANLDLNGFNITSFNDTSHGNRSGGALHSAATTSVNGFMSSGDKTKLDGIETGATADQSASEILAALLTVDGAASTLDADLLDGQQGSYYQNATNINAGTLASARLSGTYSISVTGDAGTLDGLDSTQFLRSDAADTATGVITLNDDLVFANRVTTDGHIQLYNGTAAAGYAIGIESSTLFYRSASIHRWYIASLADGGTSDYMQLTTTGLTLNGGITPTTNNTKDLGSGALKWANVYATTFQGESTSARYADLAENYVADADYEPGTVVCFGGEYEVTKQDEDHSNNIAGVISTNPAHLMNSECAGEHVATVALIGRVPCKVVGPIKKGNLLVSAGNGFARAEANPKVGSIIGRAMENMESGYGIIEIQVGRT